MAATEAQLDVVITAQDEASAAVQGAADNINSALGGVQKSAEDTSKKLGDISGNFLKMGAVMTGAGAAILAPIYGMVTAAADAEVQMAKVNAILKSMGQNTPEVANAIQKAADATLKFGFDNETASLSITKLFQATGDLSKATELNSLAMDIAIGKGIDLAEANAIVLKAVAGNAKELKSLGVVLKDNATATEIVAALQEKYAGQTKEHAKTFNGAMKSFQQYGGELMETIGAQLLPLLTKLVNFITPIIAKITEWVSEHQTLVKWILIIAGALGVLLVVVGAIVAAIGAVIGVMSVFASVAAGPVLAVIAGIGAAIAGLVGVFLILKTNWMMLWDSIKEVASSAWKWINDNVITPMVNAIQNLIDKIAKSPIGKAASAVGGAVSGVASALGFRADGGPVSGGSPYIVGERGPELFVPAMSGSIVPNGGFGGGAVSISVNLNGGLITDAVAKQIGNIIVQQFKRTSRW